MTAAVATSESEKPKKRSPIVKIVAVVLLIAVLSASLIFYLPSIVLLVQNTLDSLGRRRYTQSELNDYALNLINSDRTQNGLSEVSLSNVSSGQKHADDMLANHYLSHWDTSGNKPYMRYTLADGRGAVEENVAWYYYSLNLDAKKALSSLEYQMMHNDSDWNWGHRDNILNSFHNKVSIGVAADEHNLYFVEDFEDDYITWSTLDVSINKQVEMAGVAQLSQLRLMSVNIFYDALPQNLTPNQLKQFPYSGSYSAGYFVGMALPQGYHSAQGLTLTASTWIQNETTFQIKFDLSPATQTHGQGVYTLYLQWNQNPENAVLSYSWWNID